MPRTSCGSPAAFSAPRRARPCGCCKWPCAGRCSGAAYCGTRWTRIAGEDGANSAPSQGRAARAATAGSPRHSTPRTRSAAARQSSHAWRKCWRGASAHRDVARHAKAEDVLGVAGHAFSIAVLPLRIDVVDVRAASRRGWRAAPPRCRSRSRSPRRPRGRRSRPAIRERSFEPVTLCQKRGASARSSSSTSSSPLWITTRTDSGILSNRVPQVAPCASTKSA